MLKVYDFKTLTLEYIFPKVISVSFTKNFYSPGNFTITLPPYVTGSRYLKKNKIIAYGGETGIIKYLKQSNDVIEIKGVDLKGITSQRLVIPPFVYEDVPSVQSGYDRVKASAEQVIRHYADAHLISPSDSARKISNLELAAYHGFGDQLAWQAKFTPLSDELEKICTYCQLGYDIVFDEKDKKLIFDVLCGTDRTDTDEYFGLLTFSEKFKNISSAEYVRDYLSEKNVCYVTANGEEEQQFVYESKKQEFSGIERSEGTTTASGDDEDYTDEVSYQGLSYIKENEAAETVDAQANSKMKYKKDFFLGDFVTVAIENCFGEDISLKRQIVSVTQTWEHGKYTAEPTFGEKKKSTIKKLLRGV